MPFFKKKPVIIEAIQFDGTAASADEISRKWASDVWPDFDADEFTGFMWCNTLEGKLRADPGDWIIQGVKGEHYPCKPDIFAATYEEVEAPQ